VVSSDSGVNAQFKHHRPVFNIKQVVRDAPLDFFRRVGLAAPASLRAARACIACGRGLTSAPYVCKGSSYGADGGCGSPGDFAPPGLCRPHREIGNPAGRLWRARQTRWKVRTSDTNLAILNLSKSRAAQISRRPTLPGAFPSGEDQLISRHRRSAPAGSPNRRHSDDAKSRQRSNPSLHLKSKPSLKIDAFTQNQKDRETTCEVRCSTR